MGTDNVLLAVGLGCESGSFEQGEENLDAADAVDDILDVLDAVGLDKDLRIKFAAAAIGGATVVVEIWARA